MSNLFRFGVESTLKWKKKFPVQGKEIIVFLEGALTQSQKFSCPRKNFWKGLGPLFFEKKKLSICTNIFASSKPS